MGFFICDKCEGKNFKNELGLLRHLNRHGINVEQYILDKKHNGINPTCKCGCGEQTKYGPELKDFRDYVPGHQSRVNNNYTTEKSQNNSKATRAKMKDEGTLKGIASKELRKGRSDRMKGEKNVMFNKKHKDSTKEKISSKKKMYFANNPIAKKANGDRSKLYWSKEESKIKQSQRQTEYLLLHNLFKPSKLEEKFAEILDTLNIEYEQQYRLKENKTNGVFDFKIKNRNILIEVDGDFWHCNPKVFPTLIHPVQERNIKNDLRKNKLAIDLSYKLIRIWEYDINNNLELVKERLENEINKTNNTEP